MTSLRPLSPAVPSTLIALSHYIGATTLGSRHYSHFAKNKRLSNLLQPSVPVLSPAPGSRVGASVPSKRLHRRGPRGSAAAATSGGENGGTSQCTGSGASPGPSSRRPGCIAPIGDKSGPAGGTPPSPEPPNRIPPIPATCAAEAGHNCCGSRRSACRRTNYPSREASRRAGRLLRRRTHSVCSGVSGSRTLLW